MKRFVPVLICAALTLSLFGCTSSGRTVRHSSSSNITAPSEFVDQLKRCDVCERASFVVASHSPMLSGILNVRWVITVRITTGPQRGQLLTIHSRDDLPTGLVPKMSVLAYATRRNDDRGRYWGSILPIVQRNQRDIVWINDGGFHTPVDLQILMQQLGRTAK